MIPNYFTELGLEREAKGAASIEAYGEVCSSPDMQALRERLGLDEKAFWSYAKDAWTALRGLGGNPGLLTILDEKIMRAELDGVQSDVARQMAENPLLRNPDNKFSNPLMIRPSKSYFTAPVRLMIVGQETNSWGGSWKLDPDDLQNSYEEVCGIYEDFKCDKGLRKRPFWNAAHQIADRVVGGDRAKDSMIHGNLFPCDQDKGQSEEVHHNMLRGFRLLPRQIEVLKPEVVVFLTGPIYDYTLRDFFGKACIKSDDLEFERVWLPGSYGSTWAARTYHPGYSQPQGILPEAIDRIIGAWSNHKTAADSA